MSILLGILLLAVGSLLIIYTEWFLNNFGRITWFEEKMGVEGGSRLGYKLIGIILLFLGVTIMSGNGPDFLNWVLSPLTRYNK